MGDAAAAAATSTLLIKASRRYILSLTLSLRSIKLRALCVVVYSDDVDDSLPYIRAYIYALSIYLYTIYTRERRAFSE